MPERQKIVLHTGFHKTGTSSIQHFLWANRDKFEHDTRLVMFRHLKAACELAQAFSSSQQLLLVADLVQELESVFKGTEQSLIISSEGLLGHVPGWPKVHTYSAAETLLPTYIELLSEIFPDAEVQVILTIRDSEDWLFSIYRHLLRDLRLRLGFSEFRAAYFAASLLTDLSKTLEERIAPIPVKVLRLEDIQRHPLGPGGAFVEAANYSTDGFEPVGHGNAGADAALWHEFLRLNRSEFPDATVGEAKLKLAEDAGLGGWKPVI